MIYIVMIVAPPIAGYLFCKIANRLLAKFAL